ncbi:uncharacterized protein LOC144876017 isoform X2 [Branchiostoma floridae x Branchiostoma japonicum]
MAPKFVTPRGTLTANEYLVYSAEFGSLRGVKKALKAGADVDFDTTSDSRSSNPPNTALFSACVHGRVDIARLLLRKGASVVRRTVCAFAPLHAAAAEGWTEIVDLLVQHGATLDIRDAYKNTPLIAAFCYNHVDTLRRLIELGARPDLANYYVTKRLAEKPVGTRESEECVKLIQEAMKSKLLKCCNPACGKPGYRSTLKLCAGCKLTRYCSRDCQKQHWSVGHKRCCGHDVYPDEEPLPFQNKVASMYKRILEHLNQG